MRMIDVLNRKKIAQQIRNCGPQFQAILRPASFRSNRGNCIYSPVVTYTSEAHAERDIATWAKAGINLRVERHA